MKDQKRVIPLVSYVESFSAGITDGLTISLALAAGMWYAGFDPGTIAVACFTVSFSAALVMALGYYFSRRDQARETPEHSLKEWNRTRLLLESLGLTSEQVAQAETEWLKEKTLIEETEPYPLAQVAVPLGRVFIVGLSFLTGGSIPAWCFYLSGKPDEAFRISVVVSGLCFITFGYLKDKAIGINPWWGAMRALFIGTAAVLVSIGVARLFL